MLKLKVDSQSTWDPYKEEFGEIEGFEVELEHCLLSVSKWEAKTCKPFFDNKHDKTTDELKLYIKCMSLNKDLTDEQVIAIISDVSCLAAIKDYIDSKMTATTVTTNGPHGSGGEYLTSELIYYYLVALQIPFEVERWPIQRLIKLIEVCNAKNQPPKKMSKNDILRQNRQLNAARRIKKPRKH